MPRNLPAIALAITAATSLLAPRTVAQTAGADLIEPLPSTPSPTGIHGLAVGDFNGDRIPDLATIWSARPTVVFNPDLFANAFEVTAREAQDVATLPGAAPFGADALLAAGSAGLFLYQRGESSPAFLESPLDTASWADVRSLAVADVDGNGDVDVLGLAPTSIVRIEKTASGWEARTALPMPGAGARRIGLLDYNGDDDLEVYVVGESRVLVLDLAGAQQLLVEENEIEDAVPIRHVADQSAGKQRLTVLFESYAPTSNRWLRTFGAGGTSFGTPLGITLSARLAATNLLPVTYPGYRDDVIISHGGHVLQIGLLNVSSGDANSEPFLNTIGEGKAVAPWPTPMTPMDSEPALHDFDQDGDPDWLQQFEGIGRLWLDRSPEVNEERRKVYPAGEISTIDDDDVLHLAFRRPLDPLPGATHIEFLVYHHGLDEQGNLVPFSSSTPDVYYADLAGAAEDAVALDIQLHEKSYPNKARYHILAREARFDAGSGLLMSAGTPGLTFWSADDAFFLEIKEEYEAITEDGTSSSSTAGPPKSGGVQAGGGSATNIPICPFDPNNFPDPPAGRMGTSP